VVLAGLPNAGKSTLFNALTGSPRALVSPQAGTTRDYLTAALVWYGQPLELVDTAGETAAWEDIESTAQTLSREQRGQADLVVWCTPAALSAAELSDDAAAMAAAQSQSRRLVQIVTKADLPLNDALMTAQVRVSAEGQAGLDDLRRAVTQQLAHQHHTPRSWLGMTAARCRGSLCDGEAALSRALALLNSSSATAAAGDELLAVEIREALEHLGEIVGAVYTNDLLDRIFSRFCIGK
jgi:tRNA modification GTPase